jgi:hypothetical protein
MNDEFERQVAELAQLDEELDAKWQRIQELADRDPVGFAWYAHIDGWIDKRLS